VDAFGEESVTKRLRRSQLLEFFAGLKPCLVGIEACPTAHYWGRELKSLGHDVRLIPPQYVKPYVRRSKNDAADAAAICEAVARPSIRLACAKEGVVVVEAGDRHSHGRRAATTLDAAFWNAVRIVIDAGKALTTLNLNANSSRPLTVKSRLASCERRVGHRGGITAIAERASQARVGRNSIPTAPRRC